MVLVAEVMGRGHGDCWHGQDGGGSHWDTDESYRGKGLGNGGEAGP